MATQHLSGFVCPRCKLFNELNEFHCRRCHASLQRQRAKGLKADKDKFSLGRVLLRITLLTVFFLVAWYASLTTTSAPLNAEQRLAVERAISVAARDHLSFDGSLVESVLRPSTSLRGDELSV
jgi:hypothetical protein